VSSRQSRLPFDTPQPLSSTKDQAHQRTHRIQDTSERHTPIARTNNGYRTLIIRPLSRNIFTMRFIATTTIACATLALATPAPVSGPAVPESVPDFHHALLSRDATRPQLDTRASKPKGSKGGSSGNSSTAVSVSPSNVLVMGALGLGVIEAVRLWN
jgi:hypothetical protein